MEVADEIQQRALAVLVHGHDGLGVPDFADLVLRHAVGQITVNTARTEIGRMHAGAGHSLIDIKQVLTLTEGIDQDGRAAAIVAV